MNNLSIQQFNSFDEHMYDIMYNMYTSSYIRGGQQLFFSSKEHMFNVYKDRYVVSYNLDYLIAFVVFEQKELFNKISLVCTDGSDNGKHLAIQLLNDLIVNYKYILEASDKVSWLLRSRHNTPVITDEKLIITLLNSNVIQQNCSVIMNQNFDYNTKYTYQYTKIYKSPRTNKIYTAKEAMFGII